MEVLQAIALTCCILTGTPSVEDSLAEQLQLNSLYMEFPEELKPYLTEEQTNFLEETNFIIDESIQEQLDIILAECESAKTIEEERIKQEEEAARIAAEQEARYAAIGQNVAGALSRTGSPGVNLCAAYISRVYQNAGYHYLTGDANDMYWTYCFSSNRDELRNGMLIAVPTWNGGYMSRTYGHVGIYMDGMIWHNIGYIIQTPIDEWIAQYGQIAEVRWGFPV